MGRKISEKKMLAIFILIIAAIGSTAYFFGFMNISGFSFNFPGQAITDTEKQTTGTRIQPVGSWIFEKTISADENLYIFNHDLEERTRIVIEGSFEQPVTFLLLTEPYYSIWLREHTVKTNVVFIKDYKKEFSTRVDINEDAGGVHYFVIQSQENKMSGELKIFKLANL